MVNPSIEDGVYGKPTAECSTIGPQVIFNIASGHALVHTENDTICYNVSAGNGFSLRGGEMSTLHVVFWNLLTGNPIGLDIGSKGYEAQKTLVRVNADVFIFCEVSNKAVEEFNIALAKRTLAAEHITNVQAQQDDVEAESTSTKQVQNSQATTSVETEVPSAASGGKEEIGEAKLSNPSNEDTGKFASPVKKFPIKASSPKRRSPRSVFSNQSPTTKQDLKVLKSEMGMQSTTRRSGLVFKNGVAMSTPRVIARSRRLNRSVRNSSLHEVISSQMEQPRFKDALSKVDLAPLLKIYPHSFVYEPDQNNRNYIILSKFPMNSKTHEIEVDGAKRDIAEITVRGFRIYSVHAPAFAKGGAETVGQIAGMILLSKDLPTFAIGDFNIDADEMNIIENEVKTSSNLYKCLTECNVRIVAKQRTGKSISMERSYGKYESIGSVKRVRTFEKKAASTHLGGRTLDYVLARPDLNVEVSIVLKPDNTLSDHAAIGCVVEITGASVPPARESWDSME